MDKRASFLKLIADLDVENSDGLAVLDRFLDESRPPAITELLRRCALARCFDEALYNEVLSKDIRPPVELAEFVKQPDVQLIPRVGQASYVVKSPLRERYREQWRADPACAEWHGKIAEFEQRRKNPDPLNVLYHQVQWDKDKALQTFDAAFDAAEKKFDLAECHSLLSILDELQNELGPLLSAARERKQQIYRARALFANAYYRTSTFFFRRKPFADFKKVRDSPVKRIFNIYAAGGMGKTMFLRWLIARHLVPQRVPCARVDFDSILHANITRYPYLLLLPLAKQLNEQLPRTFFTELIGKLQAYEPWVTPRPPGAKAADSTANPDQELWDSHLNSFLAPIRYDSGIPHVVLLFDTLEVVMLEEDDFLPIFQFLERLLAAPQIILILAGRFDVLKKMPARAAALEKLVLRHHLSRFTEREGKRYLASRKLPAGIIAEIAAKAREPGESNEEPGCNPFKLALFAELLLGRESITLDDVKRLPNADLVYLLERVIRRIPEQPLRWVVRYGALPRRLTEDYIAKVLLDPLKDALHGNPDGDQLGKFGPEHIEDAQEQDYWAPDPNADPQASQLWTDLCRYESERGWISRTPSDRDTVRFHPDVTDPMRDLLMRQKIFRVLQQRSIAYFEDLAENEPHRWGDWISEAIFHSFQLNGPAAIPYWEARLSDPRTIADSTFRRQVASEILKREYADAERQPRRRQVEPPQEQEIVTRAALGKAHYETARAIENAPSFSAADPREWSDLKRHMAIAQEIQDECALNLIEPVQAARFRAAACVQAGQYQNAVEALKTALATAQSHSDRFWLAYDLSVVGTKLEDPAVIQHTHEAISLLPRDDAPGIKSSDLRIGLAGWFTSQGEFKAAYDEYHQALQEASGDATARTDVELQLAWAALKAGDYEEAHAIAHELTSKLSEETSALYRLKAWVCRILKDPAPAAEAAEKALSLAHGRDAIAYCYDLLGLICGDRMQFSRAFDNWDQALKLFSRTKAEMAVESTMIDQVALQGQSMGNYREALLTAESAARLPGMTDGEVWVRLELERLLTQSRMGDREAAAATFDKVLQREWTPVLRARVLATGLACELAQDEKRSLSELCESLARIQPPNARLELLEVLRFRERPFTAPDSLRERCLALLPALNESGLGFAARALMAAEFYRLFGSTRIAQDLLHKALPILVARGGLQAAIRAMETLRRLRSVRDWPEPPADLKDQEFARGAMLLVRAASMIDAGELSNVSGLLDEAEKLLSTERLSTYWHARLLELRAEAAFGRAARARQSLLAREAYRSLGDQPSAERVERSEQASNVKSKFGFLHSDPISSPEFQFEYSRSCIVISPAPPAGVASSLEHLTEFLSSPPAQEMLTRALLDAGAGRAIKTDLALQLATGPPSAPPWEWGTPPFIRGVYRMRADSKAVPTEIAMWMQSILAQAGAPVSVDGIYGPATAAAFGEFAKSNGIDADKLDSGIVRRIRELSSTQASKQPRRILLIEPRASQLEAGDVGYASRTGRGARDLYGDWAGVIKVLYEPQPFELSDAIAAVRPHAIHLVCALQARQGVAQLDFTRELSESGQPITAHLLSRLLGAMPSGMPRPFLVLDVARPHSTWEAVYTLCLRNQFCAELFYVEACSGVLATGLGQPSQQERLGRTIAEQLMRNASMGEAARAIRSLQAEEDSFDDRLAFASSALFSMEPELPCLSPAE